jgi:hypothetical protein
MIAYILSFSMDDKILNNPKNVKFKDLVMICRRYFGEPRIRGSHYIFKTPWEGKPFVNIQKDGSMAKPYQVKQVLSAIQKLENNNERIN